MTEEEIKYFMDGFRDEIIKEMKHRVTEMTQLTIEEPKRPCDCWLERLVCVGVRK